jgi:outer membrane protein assembly factor BamB
VSLQQPELDVQRRLMPARAWTWAVAAALVAAACSDGAGPEASARCPAAASLPLTARHVFGPPPSEDFTFDGDGYLLALDSGRSLVRVARESVPMLVAPNVVANGRGLRVLAAGDVVIADQDRSLLVRVDPAGNPRRLTTTIANPNGLALGPGGTLWTTDFGVTGDVHRVDADSGEAIALARPARGSNGLAFSSDYRVLYVGDHDGGVIYRLPLQPDGRLGAAERWAEGLGKPDGLAVDACGNVYAASWDRRVYQVTPAGEVRVLAELTETVSAVAFGSGKHGWKADSLYAVALQAGGVFEIDVGHTAPAGPPP